MKVKKFRIKPRLPVVGRILKGLMSVKKLPAEIEESLPQDILAFNSVLVPAAFYHTWPQNELPPSFLEVLAANDLEKSIAVSAVVATIGLPVEEQLSQMLMKGETSKSQVVMALAEESVDLAFAFIYKLLTDDAKADECEISEPFVVNDNSLLSETLTLMEAGQDGVTLEQGQHLSPRFTRVALVAWWPASKKKRSAPVSRKK